MSTIDVNMFVTFSGVGEPDATVEELTQLFTDRVLPANDEADLTMIRLGNLVNASVRGNHRLVATTGTLHVNYSGTAPSAGTGTVEYSLDLA